MLKAFNGDWRLVRVILASKDPIETLHRIRTGQYSIITLLDMLEILDVRETIQEDGEYLRKKATPKK